MGLLALGVLYELEGRRSSGSHHNAIFGLPVSSSVEILATPIDYVGKDGGKATTSSLEAQHDMEAHHDMVPPHGGKGEMDGEVAVLGLESRRAQSAPANRGGGGSDSESLQGCGVACLSSTLREFRVDTSLRGVDGSGASGDGGGDRPRRRGRRAARDRGTESSQRGQILEWNGGHDRGDQKRNGGARGGGGGGVGKNGHDDSTGGDSGSNNGGDDGSSTDFVKSGRSDSATTRPVGPLPRNISDGLSAVQARKVCNHSRKSCVLYHC